MPIIVTGSGSTVQVIIDRALRLLAQLESGESASTSETADCLVALNALLDTWRNERLMCWAIQTEVISLSANTSSLTIGPTGTYATTRPVEIVNAYVTYLGVDSPVTVLTEDEWAQIPLKTVTSTFLDRIWYQPTMPNGILNLYPIGTAAVTLNLQTRVPIQQFTSASATIELPPGWEEALATNLAIAVSSEYETEPKPNVIAMARAAKAGIRGSNSPLIMAPNELAGAFGRPAFNILTGR